MAERQHEMVSRVRFGIIPPLVMGEIDVWRTMARCLKMQLTMVGQWYYIRHAVNCLMM